MTRRVFRYSPSLAILAMDVIYLVAKRLRNLAREERREKINKKGKEGTIEREQNITTAISVGNEFQI